jgi:hypothetical protein
MRNTVLAVCAAVTVTASMTTLAQQGFVPAQSGIRAVESYRPESAGDTKVIGTVIDIQQVPVKYAKLQIRNLATGRLTGEAIANEKGEFEFKLEEPSTYVVEALLRDGSIGALSGAGSVNRYQTVQTVVQLPGRWDASTERVVFDQNWAVFLGVSGQTTLTAQTLELAIEQNVAPQEPGEPVSP